MKHIRNAAIAIMVITAGTVLASASGIEVLSVDSSTTGDLVTVHSVSPIGSVAEAVMNIGGAEKIVDMVGVDPATGTATVHFPMYDPNNTVRVRAPNGVVYHQSSYAEELWGD